MDHKSTFVRRFGDLVALLRFEPGNDAAQDLALTAAAAAVEEWPLEVEAGVEWSVMPAEFTPQEQAPRQARRVSSNRGGSRAA